LGRRPGLMGGGLVRSLGGWEAVQKLRRGRGGYTSDERILGRSEFVEGLIEELQRVEARRIHIARRAPDLRSLMVKVARECGVTIEALVGGWETPPGQPGPGRPGISVGGGSGTKRSAPGPGTGSPA
jgi:hypothetical protein